jgi:hypothetical protein
MFFEYIWYICGVAIFFVVLQTHILAGKGYSQILKRQIRAKSEEYTMLQLEASEEEDPLKTVELMAQANAVKTDIQYVLDRHPKLFLTDEYQNKQKLNVLKPEVEQPKQEKKETCLIEIMRNLEAKPTVLDFNKAKELRDTKHKINE